MNRPSKIALGFVGALALVTTIASKVSADDFGVWKSADIYFSEGNLVVPTPEGVADGTPYSLDSLTEIESVPDFGVAANPGYYDEIDEGFAGGITTFFLPYSLQFTGKAELWSTGAGNILIAGTQGGVYAAVDLHIDDATPYSFAGIGGAPIIPRGYPAVLSGPAGQTIDLIGPMSGILEAGDWQLLLDFQAMDDSDAASANYGGREAQFILTVPEPQVMVVESLIAFVVAFCRPRRRTGTKGAV